jgi:hypothetical protein
LSFIAKEATMTEPVEGIDRAREITEQNKRNKDHHPQEKRTQHQEVEDDSIDISDEARDRASGRRRRNIIDYINDDTA